MLTSSKIYVAGHTGLVGSAITGSLKAKGYDNLVLKTQEELDLTDQKAVELFFARELPEYVILAAAKVGGIMANNIFRADFIYHNIMIQANVIHFAWKYRVKKLLFLGSTCIYPKNAPQPLKEDYLLSSSLEHTNEPYAIAKIAGLKMCESYNIQYKTNFISVMPTNLYGAGDNFNLDNSHVIPALLRKFHLGKCLEEDDWGAIRKDFERNPVDTLSGDADEKDILVTLGKHGIGFKNTGILNPHLSDSLPNPLVKKQVVVTVWGSGSPLREFMNSRDLAEACVFLLDKIDINDIIAVHKSANNSKDYYPPHFVNIGTGNEITIKDLAFRIKTVTGFKGEVIFDSTKPDGTMRKTTDISALRNLGFIHKIDLDSGLSEMYDHYINQ
jgi:GDP-L-fucose synthase